MAEWGAPQVQAPPPLPSTELTGSVLRKRPRIHESQRVKVPRLVRETSLAARSRRLERVSPKKVTEGQRDS